MGKLEVEKTYQTGDVLDYRVLNKNFRAILNEYNGGVDNYNIKAAANIDGAKVANSSIYSKKCVLGGIVQANQGAGFALTTDYQDITSATFTNTYAVNGYLFVHATLYFSGCVSGTNFVYGALNHNGSNQSALIVFDNNNAGACETTVSQIWFLTVTAGTITTKLQAKTTVANSETVKRAVMRWKYFAR